MQLQIEKTMRTWSKNLDPGYIKTFEKIAWLQSSSNSNAYSYKIGAHERGDKSLQHVTATNRFVSQSSNKSYALQHVAQNQTGLILCHMLRRHYSVDKTFDKILLYTRCSVILVCSGLYIRHVIYIRTY